MQIKDIMTYSPHYCTPDQRGSDVAAAMWEYDLGCVPVVDDHFTPIGVVTDRDLCMACYTQNKAPSQLRVSELASKSLYTCHGNDTIGDAERIMQEHQVRRLVVLDDAGKLLGMLSLNDLACKTRDGVLNELKHRVTGDVEQTLAAICKHPPVPVGVQF